MELNKNNKIVIILSAVLILQLIILLFINIFSFQRIKLKKLSKPLFKELNKNNIVKIDITDFMDTFSLEKKGENWFVKTKDNYIPGNENKINIYLKDLTDTKKGVVIFKNSDESSDIKFGFDKVNYQKLSITTTKNKKFNLTIGNPGSKKDTSYLKVGNNNSIREVYSTISLKTDNDPIKWSEKHLFTGLTIEDIETLSVDSNDSNLYNGKYTVTYNEDATADSKKYSISPNVIGKFQDYALKNIVQNTINVTCEDYKFDAKLKDRKSLGTILITLFNGKNYKMTLYKSDNDDLGEYLCAVDFNSYVYVLSIESLKKIIKDPVSLLKK